VVKRPLGSDERQTMTRVSPRAFTLALVVASAVACGGGEGAAPVAPGDGAPGGAEAGAGSPDAGGGDAGSVSPGACHDLPVPPAVVELQEATDPPAPRGGPIVFGRYVMIARTIHTGPGGATGPSGVMRRAASEMASGVVNMIDQRNDERPARLSYTVAVSGPRLLLTSTCPTGISLDLGFTAAGDMLTIIVGREVLVMKRS
jgi:hypothetical protein